jgi:hypothetical protein
MIQEPLWETGAALFGFAWGCWTLPPGSGKLCARETINCHFGYGRRADAVWIAVAEKTGIPELRRTTRDEPDYDKLMNYRIGILDQHGIKLSDIQNVIGTPQAAARWQGVSR